MHASQHNVWTATNITLMLKFTNCWNVIPSLPKHRVPVRTTNWTPDMPSIASRSAESDSNSIDHRSCSKLRADKLCTLHQQYKWHQTYMRCVSETMHQLWEYVPHNHKDRFRWCLAEIFKILDNRVCVLQFSCRFMLVIMLSLLKLHTINNAWMFLLLICINKSEEVYEKNIK